MYIVHIATSRIADQRAQRMLLTIVVCDVAGSGASTAVGAHRVHERGTGAVQGSELDVEE